MKSRFPHRLFLFLSISLTTAACNEIAGPPEVEQIELSASPSHIGVGDTLQLTARPLDAAGSSVHAAVSWTSSDHAVAAVDPLSGLVTALGPGSVRIIAAAGKASASVDLIVTPAPASLEIGPRGMTVGVGHDLPLTAIVRDAHGLAVQMPVQWEASSAVVRVSDSGVVTGVEHGSALVTARAGRLSDTVTVGVSNPIVRVRIESAFWEGIRRRGLMRRGRTHQLTAWVSEERSGASGAEGRRLVRWSSSDEGIATIDSVGLLTAVAVGTTLVTAASEAARDSLWIRVYEIGRVEIRPEALSLIPGANHDLQAIAYSTAGDSLGGYSWQWASSDTAIANVGGHTQPLNNVQARRLGEATISASVHGVTGFARVTVILPPSTTASIAFTSTRDGNPDIFRMNPDGTGLLNLTRHPAVDSEAAWSPDRRQIAFVSTRDGNTELYTMQADGTNQRRITFTAEEERWPEWSPDGKEILFVAPNEFHPHVTAIWTIRADGTGRRQLVGSRSDNRIPSPHDRPSWAPDGRRIAFLLDAGSGFGRSLAVFDVEAGITTVIIRGSTGGSRWASYTAPKWAPDGDWIALQGNTNTYELTGIFRVRPDGTELQRLSPRDATAWHPTWSPDGRHIAYSTERDGNWEIHIMRSDGTQHYRVTQHPEPDGGPAWR